MSLTEFVSISQAQICTVEDAFKAGQHGETLEVPCEHLFADSAYARIVTFEPGSWIIGKAHRTSHFCVLLEGDLQVTSDTGAPVIISAPKLFVAPPGKKMAYALTRVRFANIHPTESTDVDVIESEVIVPEQEFRAALSTTKQELLEV